VGFVNDVLTIVSVPAEAPAVVGSNCMFSVADWPALRDSGKLVPDTENPVPASTAELTVTAVPDEVRVIDCVAGEFNVTSPKFTAVELIPSPDVPVPVLGPSFSAYVSVTPPAFAVSVTAWAVVTEAAETVNAATLVPAATVMLDGSVTAALLLARLIAIPPLAAEVLSVTRQLSVAAPVKDALEQPNPLSTGTTELLCAEAPNCSA
jgi:hypothetical protein